MISATVTLKSMRQNDKPGTRLAASFIADAFNAFSVDPDGNMETVARYLRQAANFALDAAEPEYVHVNIVESSPRIRRAS
jgi:hypothetical protein